MSSAAATPPRPASATPTAAAAPGPVPPGQAAATAARAPAVGFVSLGCPKALVDSERLISALKARGYAIAAGYDRADLVIVNTCGFIDAAIDESLQAIGEALEQNGRVLVTGCLGAHPERILERHPKVLGVTGPHAYERVIAAVDAHLPRPHNPFTELVPPQGVRLTPRHYAYLKISEGCNNRCSFCIIPQLRGRLQSRLLDDVMREAEALVSAGVRELLVISQDTSAYGSDRAYAPVRWREREYRTRFIDLARALGSLGVWVRLHYVYPYPHVDEAIALMSEPGVLPYLDVPFQHASPTVLRRMRRPAHAEDTLRRIQLWRRERPELTLRSTFIVGFPGETKAEFEQLLAWLDDAQLDRVGCFKYSPVDGAAANQLTDPVPESLKEERYRRFMQKAGEISRARLAARVGQRCRVLVDAIDADGAGLARSSAEAPEIDGVVRLIDAAQLRPSQLSSQRPQRRTRPRPQWGPELRAGEFIDVEITAADTYDLVARPIP